MCAPGITVLEVEQAKNVFESELGEDGVSAQMEIVELLEKGFRGAVWKVEEVLNCFDQKLRIFTAAGIEAEEDLSCPRQIQKPPLKVSQTRTDHLGHVGNIYLKCGEAEKP